MLKKQRKTLGQFGTDVARSMHIRKMICDTIRDRMPEIYADKSDDFIEKYTSIYPQIMIMVCNMGYEIYDAIDNFKQETICQ